MVFWWKFASKGDRFPRKLIENRFRFSLLCSLDFYTLKPLAWQMKFRVRIWIVYTFSWGNLFIITHSRSLPGFESMLWALKAKKGSKWNKHSVEKWEFHSQLKIISWKQFSVKFSFRAVDFTKVFQRNRERKFPQFKHLAKVIEIPSLDYNINIKTEFNLTHFYHCIIPNDLSKCS